MIKKIIRGTIYHVLDTLAMFPKFIVALPLAIVFAFVTVSLIGLDFTNGGGLLYVIEWLSIMLAVFVIDVVNLVTENVRYILKERYKEGRQV